MPHLLRPLLLIVVFSLSTASSRADSWMPAQVEVHASPSGDARLTVTPRELSSNLAYFEDAVDDREAPGQRPGGNPHARARLELRLADGGWRVAWEADLVNDVAPVDVLVADGGRFVATFDNWHSMGFGPATVVLYDAAGRPVRSAELVDFLPLDYLMALPRSVSSLQWRGDATLAADGVRIPVVVPSADYLDEEQERFVDFRLDPETGAIAAVDAAAWNAARVDAAAVLTALRLAEARHRERFNAPLRAPAADAGGPHWHDFLREVYFRRDPDWRDGYPATSALLAGKFRESTARALRERVIEDLRPGDGPWVVGGPDEADLRDLLVALAGELRDGALRDVRVYAVLAPARSVEVVAAFAHTGAEMIAVDPAVPIPQRRERLLDPPDEASL